MTENDPGAQAGGEREPMPERPETEWSAWAAPRSPAEPVTSQPEPPQAEIPQVETPQAERSQVEPPQAEIPQVEPSQVEIPQVELPRAEQYGAERTYERQPTHPAASLWSAESASTQRQAHADPYATPPYGQFSQSGSYGQSTAVYPALPAQRSERQGAGKLLAAVALTALLVGGAAGGVGGYLASSASGNGPVVSSLDSPKPMQQTGNAPAGSIEAVAQKLSPSVVELQVSGPQGAGEGSAFVISTDGYIMTNNHVVELAANGGQIQAMFPDGRKAPAAVVGRDPTTDIAVVKVDGVSGLTPVELGSSDNLRVGEGVVAIGSPFELAGTVTSGIVSSLHRPVRAGGDNGNQATVMDAVQTDAAINPGNSGGPLANMSGQVVGINSAIYSPQSGGGFGGQPGPGGNVGIGFAIPIDQARRTADDIIKTGHATQTYIGAGVRDAPQGGAQLGDITPGSPAEKAGLKPGDVVVKIDDRIIDNADALVAAVRTRAPNENVKLTMSDGRVIPVTLGGQPVPSN